MHFSLTPRLPNPQMLTLYLFMSSFSGERIRYQKYSGGLPLALCDAFFLLFIVLLFFFLVLGSTGYPRRLLPPAHSGLQHNSLPPDRCRLPLTALLYAFALAHRPILRPVFGNPFVIPLSSRPSTPSHGYMYEGTAAVFRCIPCFRHTAFRLFPRPPSLLFSTARFGGDLATVQ